MEAQQNRKILHIKYLFIYIYIYINVWSIHSWVALFSVVTSKLKPEASQQNPTWILSLMVPLAASSCSKNPDNQLLAIQQSTPWYWKDHWTWIIIFLVGDPYKPSFATVTGRGGLPKGYTRMMNSLGFWIVSSNICKRQMSVYMWVYDSKIVRSPYHVYANHWSLWPPGAAIGNGRTTMGSIVIHSYIFLVSLCKWCICISWKRKSACIHVHCTHNLCVYFIWYGINTYYLTYAAYNQCKQPIAIHIIYIYIINIYI